MKVAYWGTYDILKPRNRLMIKGLNECGIDVLQCHKDVWTGVEDKTQINSSWEKLFFLFRWLFSYPALLWRYAFLPKHSVVFVGYMGILDVIILWPLTWFRSVPIIFDPFVSCYNTVVEDRKKLSPKSLVSFFLFWMEKLACHLADAIIVDTVAHGEYFIDTFKLDQSKVHSVFVGAETEMFFPAEEKNKKSADGKFTVLFYGQFSPLHGVDTVLSAAALLKQEKIDWLLIGRGQEAETITAKLADLDTNNVRWLDWVPYEDLNSYLQGADVCLGIFGLTEKAQRVIPNKVFQAIAAGCPVITQDSPAIRELVPDTCACIKLLEKVTPESVAEAILAMSKNRRQYLNENDFAGLRKKITSQAIGERILQVLSYLRIAPRTS